MIGVAVPLALPDIPRDAEPIEQDIDVIDSWIGHLAMPPAGERRGVLPGKGKWFGVATPSRVGEDYSAQCEKLLYTHACQVNETPRAGTGALPYIMTDPYPLPPPPPPPDPLVAAKWAGQIRTLIAVLAGAGIIGSAWAGVSVEQISSLVTVAMTAISLGAWAWAAYKSWQDKNQARAVLVSSSAASAQKGEPVVITVTPPGQANIATKIPQAEINAAPSIPAGPPQPAPAAA